MKMQYAINDNGEKMDPIPGGRALCPGCKTVVISKCGPTNIWHWSHDSLEDCDNWRYEPKTKWHVNWQERFHKDDTEVIIKKENRFHIADIIGNDGVVLEIQNSPISADEILKREQFYTKMIWILNAKRFAQNLEIIGFNIHIDMAILQDYIVYEEDRIRNGLKRIKIIVPPWDDRTIEDCLLSNKRLYQKDKEEENIWYINDVEKRYGYELPTDLRSAFLAYALHDQFAKEFGHDNESYGIDFRWRYIKRSWLNATMPIFLDIGPRFMIYITKHNYGNDFEGKVITKKRFLSKYRKRLPE